MFRVLFLGADNKHGDEIFPSPPHAVERFSSWQDLQRKYGKCIAKVKDPNSDRVRYHFMKNGFDQVISTV